MISKTSILSIPSVPGILGMDGDGKKDRPHFWRRSICLFHNFLSQSDAHLNTVDKAGLLIIPAEGTDGIDNPVQFCQRYPIQKTVQFMEIPFDLPVAPLQVFIAFIQERQNRLAISQFQRVTRDLSRVFFRSMNIIWKHAEAKWLLRVSIYVQYVWHNCEVTVSGCILQEWVLLRIRQMGDDP